EFEAAEVKLAGEAASTVVFVGCVVTLGGWVANGLAPRPAPAGEALAPAQKLHRVATASSAATSARAGAVRIGRATSARRACPASWRAPSVVIPDISSPWSLSGPHRRGRLRPH